MWTSAQLPVAPEFLSAHHAAKSKAADIPSRLSSHGGIQISANDPSAGSPTETLLRLLLPLSDKVHLNFPTQRPEAEHCISPNDSPDHSIGRSDGRCVQRAGTQSARADDSRLLGIPR